MRPVEATDVDVTLPLETIQSVLRKYPVHLGILFGSHAKETVHSRSDIDIAVEFDGLQPTDDEYNETFFGLSADLCIELKTDDVDLLDINTISPTVAASVFDHGILLIGDQTHAAELQRRLTAREHDDRSPRERIDAAIAKINNHLGYTSVTATDDSRKNR